MRRMRRNPSGASPIFFHGGGDTIITDGMAGEGYRFISYLEEDVTFRFEAAMTVVH